ncbi:MAG: YfhO family protein, partial [Patescibacteria group bacterium]
KVPYSSTYQVNFFAPWSHHEKFWGPVKNNAMPDVHTQIYPWKKFTIDTFKNGQVPLWNPYSFSGNPHLANFQSAVLSPFNLLFFTLPFVDAWSILILLQPLLAGIFMYLFVREIGVSRVGALISSISFMFCGFIVVWMAYGTLSLAISFLPLALFAIEKFYNKKKIRYLVLLSLTIPLSFFSGHFQISLYFLAAILLFIVFRGLAAREILNIFYLLLSAIFGILISLLQILPSIELYRHSVRSEIFQISEAIPFQYLITIISPDFFGNPVTRNDWFGHYAEWAGFIGILPLFLAIFSVWEVRRKVVVFFAVLGIASLILAVNSPISELLVSLKIPVLSTSALSRVVILFSFSFAVLAGIGLDGLGRGIRDVRKLIMAFVLIGLFFAVLWLLLYFGKIYPAEWLIVAKRNFALPTILFLGAIFAVLISSKEKKFIIFLTSYFLFLTSFDSLRFAQKWMPFDPVQLVYPETPIVEAIKKNIGSSRIYGNLGTEVTAYYGFPSLEGYDPLYIGRYGEFIRGANSGEFLKGERSVVKLDRRGKYTDRVLDLLGVGLIFHPVADTNQGWAYPVWENKKRYELVYQDDKFQLFKNNFSLPRAALFYSYKIVKDSREIIKRFYSDNFDFRNVLVLEETPNLKVESNASGSAKVISYSPNKVVIQTTTNSPALLFL